MPRFKVQVRYEMAREITVYARDEQAAEEMAVEIVGGWKDVLSAEAVDVDRKT